MLTIILAAQLGDSEDVIIAAGQRFFLINFSLKSKLLQFHGQQCIFGKFE